MVPVKKPLIVNALRAVFMIYIRQLRALGAPTLWFIDLNVATGHIQYTFLSLCQIFARENGQNEITSMIVRHFLVCQPWVPGLETGT